MKIDQLYNKMIAEKLSYRELAPRIKPSITYAGLYYHVKRYCKENDLPLPQNRAGVKPRDRNFNLF